MKLCSLILQEHFGETVRIVGEDLFAAVTKTVSGICSTTKLPRRKVKIYKILKLLLLTEVILCFRSLLVSPFSCSTDW